MTKAADILTEAIELEERVSAAADAWERHAEELGRSLADYVESARSFRRAWRGARLAVLLQCIFVAILGVTVLGRRDLDPVTHLLAIVAAVETIAVVLVLRGLLRTRAFRS